MGQTSLDFTVPDDIAFEYQDEIKKEVGRRIQIQHKQIDRQIIRLAVVELLKRMKQGSLTLHKFADNAILAEFKRRDDNQLIKTESLSRKNGYEDELQHLIDKILE